MLSRFIAAVFTALSLSLSFVVVGCDGGDDAGEGEGEGEGEPQACPDGQLLCGALCVDPLTSNTNCGASGACLADDEKGEACAAGFVCDGSGACAPSCAAPFTECGDGDAAGCADLDNDAAHCGACDNACDAGASCSGGTCCTTGLLGCDGACVNATEDEANCGGCGVACPAGASCTDAACLCPAAAPDVCDGACTAVARDAANCGACGNACDAGAVCFDGTCTDLAGDLRIAGLSTTDCTVVEHEAITGDDRGGIAMSGGTVFYTGDGRTARFDAPDLQATGLGATLDALFSDVVSGQLYSLGADGAPFLPFSGGLVDAILLLDVDGNVTGEIPLSEPLPVPLVLGGGAPAGLFAGAGRLVILDAVAPAGGEGEGEGEGGVDAGPGGGGGGGGGATAYAIDLATGEVTSRAAPALSFPTPCENWAIWGVLERFDGEDWVAYAQSFGPQGPAIVRTRLSDGVVEVVQSIPAGISDMCSFSWSPVTQQWGFHYEGGGFAGGLAETVGTCSASVCVGDSCACAAAQPDVCGDRCVDIDSDNAHCGACDSPCAGSCVDGVCGVCPAGAPDQCFDENFGFNICTDTNNDGNHCGECGNRCVAGAGCANGECQPCPPFAPDTCDNGGGPFCTDTNFDTQNCGACGDACPIANEGCVDGVCSGCGPFDVCDIGGTDFCVDTNFDSQHCGACNDPCAPGEECNAGVCGCPFFIPDQCTDVVFGDFCTNLDNDPRNCGACGDACGNGQECIGGRCDCPAFAPETCLDANAAPFCTDLSFDEDNCGACGVACTDGQECFGSQCRCAATDPDICPDAGGAFCTDLDTDPENCGACGDACPIGNQQCDDGACACPANRTELCPDGNGGQLCTSTQFDADNCGACGTACPDGEGCAAGVCAPFTSFVGVQTDIPETDIVGWTECYTDNYGFGASIDEVLAACPGDNLMLACRRIDAPGVLQVLAHAPRADVTFETGGPTNATHNANDVEWYFDRNFSWGFAPGGAAVNLNSCDIDAPGGLADQRICWHTGADALQDGFRCGVDQFLGGGGLFERVIYQF